MSCHSSEPWKRQSDHCPLPTVWVAQVACNLWVPQAQANGLTAIDAPDMALLLLRNPCCKQQGDPLENELGRATWCVQARTLRGSEHQALLLFRQGAVASVDPRQKLSRSRSNPVSSWTDSSFSTKPYLA